MSRATRQWWGVCWMLAIVPVVSACTDEPSAPKASRQNESRDLEFMLPAVQAPAAVAGELGEWKEGRIPDSPPGSAQASEGGGEARAYIHDSYVTAHFTGGDLNYEYGMVMYGTGYEMSPRITLISPDGSVLRSEESRGIRLNIAPVLTFMRPAMRQTFPTNVECGLSARVAVQYRAFIGLNVKSVTIGLDASIEHSASTSQPACQTTPSDGGGRGGSGGDLGGSGGYTICYYEVWVDAWGRIIMYNLMSCQTYTTFAT